MTGSSRPRAATIWMLHTALDLEAVNVHLAALDAQHVCGVVERDGRSVVYLRQRVDVPGLDGSWEPVEEREWDREWRRGLDAVTVGAVTVTPPWLPHPDDAIVIEPGQAFGTGHHETTTGCLAALQELALEQRSVLDVGTGSGVLAICAWRLGARPVVAVDVDPVAVAVARGNAVANHADVDVVAGSVDDVDGRFDVVVANLDTDTLRKLASGLRRRLADGGTLVASGVSLERLPEAVEALRDAGWQLSARPGREWAVLLGR